MREVPVTDHRLTDFELHRIARRASWSENRPTLSRDQIETLPELFEHPIIPGKLLL